MGNTIQSISNISKMKFDQILSVMSSLQNLIFSLYLHIKVLFPPRYNLVFPPFTGILMTFCVTDTLQVYNLMP